MCCDGIKAFASEAAVGFYEHCIVPHLVSLAMRNRQLAPYRERTLAQAKGRVLEIGVGSGIGAILMASALIVMGQ
jgi:hypothetical protein